MTETPPDTSGPAPSRGLRRWALFCVVWCVLLLLAGANVRTQRGGLTIPDWPWMYGDLVPGWDKIRQMLGPDALRAEYLHRKIAEIMGLLTIVLAVWAQIREPRAWVRKLCWGALALVIAQGIFGGLGVLTMLGPPWPLLHSVFAQIYLCLLVTITTVMAPWWRTFEERPLDATSIPIMRGSAVGVLVLLVHLMLGAAARHGYLAREVHAMFALVVTIVLVKVVLSSWGDAPKDLTLLRRPGLIIGVLVGAQIVLGMASYFVASERRETQPLGLGSIATLNLHLVLGALLLATTLVLFLRAVRVYGIPTDERVAESGVTR